MQEVWLHETDCGSTRSPSLEMPAPGPPTRLVDAFEVMRAATSLTTFAGTVDELVLVPPPQPTVRSKTGTTASKTQAAALRLLGFSDNPQMWDNLLTLITISPWRFHCGTLPIGSKLRLKRSART